MNFFSIAFIIALMSYLFMQFWLDWRQITHVRAHRAQVPDDFAADISLTEHQKAADYTLANKRFGHIEAVFAVVLLLLWTLGGGFNWIDNLWRGLDLNQIWTGIGFILTISLIGSMLDLPFSWYKTFHLEQKYGFNKTTVKLFVIDMLKGLALSLVIGIPLLYVVLWLMQSAGSLWWLWVWLVWISFSLALMWLFPVVIAPMFNKFKPLDDQDLADKIDQLLKRTGFKSSGVFVMDGSKRSGHGNAYFTGFGKSKRIVFFDTLLKSLTVSEVEAVLAHELGHFKFNHIKKGIVIMSLMTLIGLWILGFVIDKEWFYHGLGVSQPSSYMALVLFFMVAPIFTFLLTPLSSWFSRKHEYQADAFAVKNADGHKLITALVKMYKDNASTLTPDPVHSLVYDSHPPAPLRIAHIKKELQT